MALKLHQIVALASDKKKRAQAAITEAHHLTQKPEPLNGLIREYRPRYEGGETLPTEKKTVQTSIGGVVNSIYKSLEDMFDIVASQDAGNRVASADVIVDGQTILKAVPAPTLLFLEKQLTDLRTFVEKLVTLDPSHTWNFDSVSGLFKSETNTVVATKKVPKNHVLAKATDKHAEQVHLYHEDIVVGDRETTLFSGAIPATKKNELLLRVIKLREAVIAAREYANRIDVEPVSIGKPVLSFVFGDLLAI